jgi:hypothetical protein
MSVDILGAVPVAPLRIEVDLLRSGRRLELLEARAVADGRVVMVARAWRVAVTPDDVPSRPDDPPLDPPRLPRARPYHLPGVHTDGYLSAVDFRFERGAFDEWGPALAWARPRVPLLEGEDLTGWQRVLVVADSGSGISMVHDPTTHPAINCDLTVVLHRDPETDWVGLDAQTVINAGSGAMTSTTILDRRGPIGVGVQTMLAS